MPKCIKTYKDDNHSEKQAKGRIGKSAQHKNGKQPM
jgi:hypothetical protein